MNPRIVCAANQHEDGIIILGIRHWDSHMHKQAALLNLKESRTKDYWIEGFIDQFGTFYNRTEAFQLAAKNNQILRMVGGDSNELYSEHLY